MSTTNITPTIAASTPTPDLIRNDPRFPTLLSNIRQCWQSVGGDTIDACNECEQRLTNKTAIETCIDANRLTMYPGGEEGAASDNFVTELCKQGGYTILMKVLKKAIFLV